MNKHSILNLCVLTFFLLQSENSLGDDGKYVACAPMSCGNQNISYPFYVDGVHQPYCGFPGFKLTCNTSYPIISLPDNANDNDYVVERISYENSFVRVYNAAFGGLIPGGCLPSLRNITRGNQFEFWNNVSMLFLFSNCSTEVSERLGRNRIGCDEDNWDFAMLNNDENFGSAVEGCREEVVAPVEVNNGDTREARNGIGAVYEGWLTRGFVLKWTASYCSVCQESGGRCGFNGTSIDFLCFCPDRPHARSCKPRKINTTLILATVIPGGIIVTVLLAIIITIRRRKYAKHLRSRNISSDPSSSIPDLEGGSAYFGIPVFSHTELEEATNNFDPTKELGDGGYGTVYYGKLKDGREVAVKRLYENNYKRVEQFMNEIEILTRLRHKNLVSLYGCTSRRSRELLLVYEYIPNGTVADHLHGDRAKPSSLTWPIRMNIAIETASALAYLHASGIIHRDVKTNNILLDSNFCVKVADFGLSKLFPFAATHVSTAPQGTPGYVDPEYHQCYQLTDRSDVYSFGVVLIELISSMPAVDIGRRRHEINLANLAINRIQRSAFNELIDPCLGFQSDATVERMTTSVAELAFQCLQSEKEMRPAMDEVLDVLKEIQDQDCSAETRKGDDSVGDMKKMTAPHSPESEDVVLLKNPKLPPSPISVTDKWVTCSPRTTSSSS